MSGGNNNVPAARMVFSEDDRRAVGALIDEALVSGSLTLGPLTKRFEAAFAARHGAGHAAAVSSGSAALELILRGLDVAGKHVIVPTNTFFATAAAVIRAGGQPVLADIDPVTLALSPETVMAATTPATAGIVLVHIGGLVSPAVTELRALCERQSWFFVEDAAHAHGAGYRGRPAGTFGDAAAFSFYPTKVITTGEGGMVVTADERLHDEAVIYRDQGKAGFLGGDHVRLGSAWRMSELHAAVGVVQLARLDEFIETRRRIASIYDKALGQQSGVSPLRIPDGCEPNYYKYIAMLDQGVSRSDVKQRVATKGVTMSGEVYAKPLHRQPIFANMSDAPFPIADDVCDRHVCLPIHSDMTESEAMRVVDALTEAL